MKQTRNVSERVPCFYHPSSTTKKCGVMGGGVEENRFLLCLLMETNIDYSSD